MELRPPTPTLFPYTTLFRSQLLGEGLQQRPEELVADPAEDEHEGEARQRLGLALLARLEQQGRQGGAERQRVECRDHRSEEHTSELQSLRHLVCRLLLEKKT